MVPRLTGERLQLSRDGADVFVSEEFAPHLRPYQRDGVRFLYRQYCKKSPGVMLCDAGGYGKTVQAVLFVEGVRRQARLPTLVLCDREDHWTYHFHLWTNSAGDVLSDGSNVFAKKEVFIASIDKCAQMTRREWGVVIVDSEVSLSMVKHLKPIKATFKVWLSNENFLNNLPNLASVYEWIFPKDKLNVQLYNKAGLSAAERVEKDIQLDILCQDLLLRRTSESFVDNKEVQEELFRIWLREKTVNRERYFNSSEKSNSIRHTFPASDSTNPDMVSVNSVKLIVTRKNKDATGLKIKRSKPLIHTSNDVEVKKSKNEIIDNVGPSDEGNKCVHSSVPNTPVSTQINDKKDVTIASASKDIDNVNKNSNIQNIDGITDNKNVNIIVKSKDVVSVNKYLSIQLNIDGKTDQKDIVNIPVQSEDIVSVNNKSNVDMNTDGETDKDKVNNVSFKEIVPISLSSQDIHSSIRKIEEIANKKFNGSFLDTLF